MAYNFSQISGDNVTGAGFSYRGQSAAGIMMNNPPAGADGGDGDDERFQAQQQRMQRSSVG